MLAKIHYLLSGNICSIVALYFSFFVLGIAADIEIFKDFTRAKNGKEQVKGIFISWQPLKSCFLNGIL